MSSKVEGDVGTALQSGVAAPSTTPAYVTPIFDDGDERWGGHALPGDHPAWMKDTVSLSQRARALIAKLKPVVIRVATYWDHNVRSILCGGRRLAVDACGSYRLD